MMIVCMKKPFSSTIKFDIFDKSTELAIGIISQRNFEYDRKLINYLRSALPNADIVVMLHPGTLNYSDYSTLVQQRV